MPAIIEYYAPGDRLSFTVAAGQSVVGGNLVEFAAAGTIQPAGADSALCLGVAAYDGAAGDVVTVINDGVVSLLSAHGSTLAPGTRIICAAAGAFKGANATATYAANDVNKQVGWTLASIVTATSGLVKLTLG